MKKKIDALGRIGIPKYIREDMKLSENSAVVIDYNSEKKQIRITKADVCCFLCGGNTDLIPITQERSLCKNCLEGIKNKL